MTLEPGAVVTSTKTAPTKVEPVNPEPEALKPAKQQAHAPGGWLIQIGARHSIPADPGRPGKTPDYGVTLGGVEIVFEVKEIVAERAWVDDVVHGGTVGERIRQKINASKGQMQVASRQGKPTVLLIFNNYDPLHLSGTENHDFEHAMYGEYTLRMDVVTRQIVDRFHGQGKTFQRVKTPRSARWGA